MAQVTVHHPGAGRVSRQIEQWSGLSPRMHLLVEVGGWEGMSKEAPERRCESRRPGEDHFTETL